MKINIKYINKVAFFFFMFSLLNITAIQAQKETYIEKDSLTYVNVAFGKVAQNDLLGAVSAINVPELLHKNYYTNSLGNLQAFIGGYNGNIWGQDGGIVLIDGIPRDSWYVNPTEIESITVLKGASAIVLYGSLAAKGVTLITTKRGVEKPLSIDFRVNTGMYVPKRYPVYLNAAEYMTLYNEARVNDGLTELYSKDQIYHTAEGNNPYRYPDLNLYSSEYLKKAFNQTDATMEVSGGNTRTSYYSNFGMTRSGDIMNYGEQKNNNSMKFNVRGNVNMKITEWLTASTDAAAVFSDSYNGRGDFWGAASTMRPNLYSPLVPIDMLDQNNSAITSLLETSTRSVNGKYLYGGIQSNQTHAFADMLAGGYQKLKERAFMFNVNLNVDLGSLTEGLSFNTCYSVDYNSFYTETWAEDYATYEPTWSNMNGKDIIIGLTKYGEDKPSTNESIGIAMFGQTMSFRGHFDYKRSFGEKHNFSGLLGVWGYQLQNAIPSDNYETVSSTDGNVRSSYHRTSNANIGLQLGYNFLHKYYFDFSSSLNHSSKLPEGKRNGFSPALTLGWRLSEESFLKDNVSFIDNLKIIVSYANIKQDIDITDWYLYKGDFNDRAVWYVRDIRGGVNGTQSRRGENLNLSFVNREEYRAGLELSMLNKFITLDANYFQQYMKGMLATGVNTVYPSYYQTGGFLPQINYEEVKRSGFDFTLNLNKKIGQVETTLGFSGMYFFSKALVRDETWADDYQYRVGKPLDSRWGLLCEGFFKDQKDIDSHARQTFGNVNPGDLKYTDVNKDGVVDSRDQVYLGHNGWDASPFTYGLNLTMKWKNFTLFALGTGNSGAIGMKDNDYYRVRGNRKYSEVVWGRWREGADNSAATYPRLSTLDNNNNFQTSDFWMYKTNRFDLRRVQLTYDFPKQIFAKSFIKELSIYVNADNLLTLSKESKLMETNIGSAPQTRFFNIGVKTQF